MGRSATPVSEDKDGGFVAGDVYFLDASSVDESFEDAEGGKEKACDGDEEGHTEEFSFDAVLEGHAHPVEEGAENEGLLGDFKAYGFCHASYCSRS